MTRAHEHLLDPTWTFLNHGSFGSTPRPLLELQTRLRAEMEAQPVAFLDRQLFGRLRPELAAAADLLGADPAGLAFVRNATTAVAVALHSLALEAGDQLVTTTHRYDAVANALRHFADRASAQVVEAALPFPLPGPQAVLDAIDAAIGPRTRLVLVDWITSPTALVLPVADIVALCRARGVPVMIDGAHSPGHVDVDLGALAPDLYTGNLHKWLCAPKGTAVMWASAAWRDRLHHPIVSHGYGLGLQAELLWTGTDDPTGWLCTSAAVQRHRDLGGPAFRAANHELVLAARDRLASRLDLSAPAPDDMVGSMATLPLPLPFDDRQRLLDGLRGARIEVPVIPWGDRLWLRLSAFSSYNHIEQYDHLGDVLADLL